MPWKGAWACWHAGMLAIELISLVLTCVLHMHNVVQVARVGPLRDQGMAGNDSGSHTWAR